VAPLACAHILLLNCLAVMANVLTDHKQNLLPPPALVWKRGLHKTQTKEKKAGSAHLAESWPD
jgi:hypothetical protein